MGTFKTRRLPVGFSEAQHTALSERARLSGLSLSATVRQLVTAALTFDTEPGTRPDSPAALAALVAAEHATLMVASVLPDGERRMQDLAASAAVAAEERLTLFRAGDH